MGFLVSNLPDSPKSETIKAEPLLVGGKRQFDLSSTFRFSIQSIRTMRGIIWRHVLSLCGKSMNKCPNGHQHDASCSAWYPGKKGSASPRFFTAFSSSTNRRTNLAVCCQALDVANYTSKSSTLHKPHVRCPSGSPWLRGSRGSIYILSARQKGLKRRFSDITRGITWRSNNAQP